MDDKQKRLRLLELELELRKRKANISVGPSTQGGGSTVITKAPEPMPIPQDFNAKRELMIEGSGLAAGAAGAIPDLVMLPSRGLGAVVAGVGKAAEMAGGGQTATNIKKSGMNVLSAPSFTSKAQGFIDRNIGSPSNMNAGEKARQAGAQTVGSLLGGGGLKTGLQTAGKALMTQSPRVAQGLKSIASSAPMKFIAPQRGRELVGAYGGGAGAEFFQDYARRETENPWLQLGAGVAGGLAGGLPAYGGGAAIGSASKRLVNKISSKSTGVGKNLVGEAGKSKIDPDREFSQLSGTVRRSAANDLKSVRASYRQAEELSPRGHFTDYAIEQLKGTISALTETLDEEPIKRHLQALKILSNIQEKKGLVGIGDVARTLRRGYSELSKDENGAVRNAGKEGVQAVDNFLNASLDNPNMTQGAAAPAIKAWKNATSKARDYFTKYSDPEEISQIVSKEARTNRKLTPSQVGGFFQPTGGQSNLENVWDATLSAVPSGEKSNITKAIKAGIMHKGLKDSLIQTQDGLSIDKTKAVDFLTKLQKEPSFSKRFTQAEQNSVRMLGREFARPNIDIKNVIPGIIYILSRSGFGATKAVIGSSLENPTAELDKIINLLDKPINIGAQVKGGIPRASIAVAKHMMQPKEEDNSQPSTQILMPSPDSPSPMTTQVKPANGRMNYSKAKQQLGIDNE